MAAGSLRTIRYGSARQLQELEHVDVGFVSFTEAPDLTTSAAPAMAGFLAIFAEFKRESFVNEPAPVWPRPGGMAKAWASR
jgi:hypothetical protein